jgi:hypothetical protein
MRTLVLLSVACCLGAAAACGSSLPQGGNGGTGAQGGSGGSAGIMGGGGAGGQTVDAADCQCHLGADGGAQVLTISWDCFCATYGCAPANSCADVSGFAVQRTAYPSCKLTAYSIDPAGGPEIWVYDASGAEVGAQLSSDDSTFYCPSDHTLSAFRLRAGTFPDSTCQGSTCGCTAGAGGGAGGASACSPADAAIQ